MPTDSVFPRRLLNASSFWWLFVRSSGKQPGRGDNLLDEDSCSWEWWWTWKTVADLSSFRKSISMTWVRILQGVAASQSFLSWPNCTFLTCSIGRLAKATAKRWWKTRPTMDWSTFQSSFFLPLGMWLTEVPEGRKKSGCESCCIKHLQNTGVSFLHSIVLKNALFFAMFQDFIYFFPEFLRAHVAASLEIHFPFHLPASKARNCQTNSVNLD